LLSIFTLSRLPAVTNTLLLIAASIVWIFFAYRISLHDDSFSASGPLASFLMLLIVAIPYQWQMTQNKARDLLDALNHYVAPAVVNELLNSGLLDPLAPRLHDMTTLVADMEGYTKHVEGLPLEDAASLTREFLDCLTQPVLKCRGTLDKYTGDGLIAFWGAPIQDEDHADLALDAARLMLQSIAALNASRKRVGKSELRVRIGIESGMAMSGDFGSSSRSIYTAVGDSVNTASRLEDMARNFPFDIMVGPGAAQRVKRHQLMPLGSQQLRGKKNPTALFTLAITP
jgi:adenylate cyclase